MRLFHQAIDVYKRQQMGFHYLGPIDGHDLKDLTRAMETAKKINRPVLLHVETIKGKGYTFAAESPDRYHGCLLYTSRCV